MEGYWNTISTVGSYVEIPIIGLKDLGNMVAGPTNVHHESYAVSYTHLTLPTILLV